MYVEINGEMWTLGESLGSGGFGRVYSAQSARSNAVVKLVPKDPSAQRELLVGSDLADITYAIPIIGVGDGGTNWAILMPRAEKSLRDFLTSAGGQLPTASATAIMIDISHTLVSLANKGIVHRDLKPENILFIDGHWHLADFGISRYAEAVTATDTLKYSMTKPYAAPEQWRHERATAATDVYAFGVIAYELLSGQWPFKGPDFRLQHLQDLPPGLPEEIDESMRDIINECLIKSPQARPAVDRLLSRLESSVVPKVSTEGATALRAAHRAEVSRIVEESRRTEIERENRARQDELFDASRQLFLHLENRIRNFIITHAPSAVSEGWPIKFGPGRVDLTAPRRARLPPSSPPFEVISYCEIRLFRSDSRPSGYLGRSHSLWYCDAHSEGVFGWFETAFMLHPLISRSAGSVGRNGYSPFAIPPHDDGVAVALRKGIGSYMVAWPFMPLHDQGLDEFVNRWATWLARAREAPLSQPGTMPERETTSSWRQ